MTTRELIGLTDVLRRKIEDEALVNDVKKIRKQAETILVKITETFPEYTIHDIRHSEQVLRILSWLIPRDLQSKMNKYEIFFLIVSCYLHDIGMVNFPELLDEELRQTVSDEIKRSHIRRVHHIRSEKFIVNNYQKLGIEDEHQARIIGRICRGHRDRLDERSLYNNREMYTSKNLPINVPFLSALLQIADDLDISFERTPILLFETIKPKDNLSLQEWERHLSTCGVGLDPDNAARIIVSAKCSNPNVHRVLKRLETRIQEKLDVLPDLLFQYQEYASSFPQRILVMIETIGYEAIDLQFKLQEKEITTLLMGERLYDRKEVALRELLQNSYDACRFRRALEPNIKPSIVFQHTADKSRVIVEDNGVGMDRGQVEKYFTRIGSCFYKSQEFLESKTDFTPVSAFGIGILSTFMISDHIIVETKAKDSPSLVIEIDDVEGYFLMRSGTRLGTGTSVTLFLREEFRETLDIEKEIKIYARHLEFPIEIISPDGTRKCVAPAHEKPSIELFLERKDPVAQHQAMELYSFRLFEVKKTNFEATFGFLCKKDRDFGLVPISGWYGHELLIRQNKVFVSNEGVFLKEINDLFPPYFNRGIYADVNLHGNIVDLNISRTGLVKNEKLTKLVSFLEDTVLDLFRNWINISEDEHGFLPFFRNAISTHYIDTEVLSHIRYSLPKDVKASDALRNFFREVYCFNVFSKDKEFFFTWSDLSKTGKTVNLLSNSPLTRETYEYTKDLLRNCDAFVPNQLYLMRDWGIGNELEFCDPKMEVFRSIKSFASMFDKEAVQTPLTKVFLKTWKVVRFKNLKTPRIFEILSNPYGGMGNYINAENPFIALLLKRPDIILADADKILIVESFFIRLKRDLKNNFEKVVEKQKHILDWYADSDIIDGTNSFILTKQQIPHHYR